MSAKQRNGWPPEQVIPLLERVSLFQGLSPDDLRQIAELVKGMTLEDGELLFEEGDPGDAFYIVFDGAVEIVKDAGGVEERLAIRRSGEAFGEMALLDDVPRSASARAKERSQLMVITQDDFERLLEVDTLAARMMKALSRALRSLNVRFAATQRRGQSGSVSAEEMSRLVQRGLLPRNVPRAEGYDVAAGTSLPPGSMGQTIWDWFPVVGDREALTVLRVQGHGLPPIHQCSQARVLLRELARDHGSAEELLGRVNHALTEIALEGVDQVVECGLVLLNEEGIEWASAGPLLVGVVTREGELRQLTAHGPPLGMMAGFQYSAEAVPLESGEALLVISEGAQGLLEGAIDLVASRKDQPPGDVVSALHRGILKASGDGAVDVSVLFVRKQ